MPTSRANPVLNVLRGRPAGADGAVDRRPEPDLAPSTNHPGKTNRAAANLLMLRGRRAMLLCRQDDASPAEHERAPAEHEQVWSGQGVAAGSAGTAMLNIQGTPNLSMNMPYSSPHICFSSGVMTLAPSDSPAQ